LLKEIHYIRLESDELQKKNKKQMLDLFEAAKNEVFNIIIKLNFIIKIIDNFSIENLN